MYVERVCLMDGMKRKRKPRWYAFMRYMGWDWDGRKWIWTGVSR